MIELRETTGADSGFAQIVERALNNVLERSRPSEVYVVQVDGWFDYKWQQFSGTVIITILWRSTIEQPVPTGAIALSQVFVLAAQLGCLFTRRKEQMDGANANPS